MLVDLDDIGTGARVLDVAFPLIEQLATEQCVFRTDLAAAFYGSHVAQIRLAGEELRPRSPCRALWADWRSVGTEMSQIRD